MKKLSERFDIKFQTLNQSDTHLLSVGVGGDFSKFDSRFACARSAQKNCQNLPALVALMLKICLPSTPKPDAVTKFRSKCNTSLQFCI